MFLVYPWYINSYLVNILCSGGSWHKIRCRKKNFLRRGLCFFYNFLRRGLYLEQIKKNRCRICDTCSHVEPPLILCKNSFFLCVEHLHPISHPFFHIVFMLENIYSGLLAVLVRLPGPIFLVWFYACLIHVSKCIKK